MIRLLPLLFCVVVASASIGGKTSPRGVELQVDLPASQHLMNAAGSDGAGLCVFTSIGHSARWQHVEVLENFRDYAKAFPGGGWPEKVTTYIDKISKEHGVPQPRYFQITGKREVLEVLRASLRSGRMPAVTYAFSPSGRYGGRRIAHMVSLVHLDENEACILDNNFPGDDKYEWLSAEEFYRSFAGLGGSGWAVVLLDAGPPPLPWN